MYVPVALSLTFVLLIWPPSSAQLCGGGESADAMCPQGLCSAGSGSCGSGFLRRCGSDVTFSSPSGEGGGISSVISATNFEEILRHRNDENCPGRGFYSYAAFVSAATSFLGFGTTGDLNTRKREVAAFLAQTSHETTGGWATAPDGPYAWGYCFVNASLKETNCFSSSPWPCASGKQYYGRGPFQITYNFNYGAAGRAIGVDLLNNPDLVATTPTISFKTALWFWLTPQGNKPSCHDIITGKWVPSNDDISAGRLPGYGLITNLISTQECSNDNDARAADRVGFYKRYCDILRVGYEDNLNCNGQQSFS